jgi:hypothetical protein
MTEYLRQLSVSLCTQKVLFPLGPEWIHFTEMMILMTPFLSVLEILVRHEGYYL